MSLLAATVILVIATVLALLVAAPLLYLLRRARRRTQGEQSRPEQLGLSGQPLTLLQALPGLLIVAVLFFAFATEYIAPQSWLGQRVTTMEGKLWLFVLVWLTLFAIGRATRDFRSRSTADRDPD